MNVYFDIFCWVVYAAIFIVAIFYDIIWKKYVTITLSGTAIPDYRKGEILKVNSLGTKVKVHKIKKIESNNTIIVTVKPLNN